MSVPAKRARKRFDHGPPISGIDTRPMVFVFFLVALVFLLFAQRPSFDLLPRLELPVLSSQEVEVDTTALVVSITTTDVNGREPGVDHLGAVRSGDCRVYFGDKGPISSQELYDSAFFSLESILMFYPGTYLTEDQFDSQYPPMLVRADAKTPWKCVAGVLYNLEAVGFPEVQLLTRPVA